jgi:hydrogenase maturation protease
MKPLLILGIGNVIMQDEGVGIHVVRLLEQTETLPEGVDVLDGATGGCFLMGDVAAYERVILIDATLDDCPPGTVRLIHPRYADDYPPLMSAHEFGLKNMLDALSFLEVMPETYLIVVSVSEVKTMGLELTPEVRAVVPDVVRLVKNLIAELIPGYTPTPTPDVMPVIPPEHLVVS